MALSSTVDEDAPVGVDASKVDIAELGELAVIVDGETQVIVGTKTRLVLALLSLKQPEAVTVDHLLDTVWPPPEQPSSARQSLSNVIHRLRQVIGADSILTAGNTYRLAPGIRSHRTELLALPATIRAMLNDGHADRAAELAERALRTWRGEPWSGLDDVDPVLADRVVLEASRLEIEGLAASAAAALGEWTAARDAWDRMVAVRPYQESWWCSAAEAREQLGDRVEALRVLRRARASLDQAGVLPGPRLVALEQRLLGEGGRPAGTPSETEVDEPALVDRRATPSLLVAEKTSFIGRTRELDRLVTARRRPDASTPRVSFVAGPAGMGESRLAVEAARRCAAHVVLCGRSEQGSESTLGPFRQILDEYASSVTVEERHHDAGLSGATLGVRLNSFADLAPSAGPLPRPSRTRPNSSMGWSTCSSRQAVVGLCSWSSTTSNGRRRRHSMSCDTSSPGRRPTR